MNPKNIENFYDEHLLQYAIDINWLVNRLSRTKRNEALAYELAISSIDIYKYKDDDISPEKKKLLTDKIRKIGNCLLVLQKEDCSNLKTEIDRLINKTNLMLRGSFGGFQ